MTKETELKRGVPVIERARALAKADPAGAGALLRHHGLSEAGIAEVLHGAPVENVRCEFCDATVPVTKARSVDDFWVCSTCSDKVDT